MITKFRTGDSEPIKEIEVERESDSSIWIDGRRSSKESSYLNYFDTWEEAHNFLMEKATADAKACKIKYIEAKKDLEEIKDLKEQG